jgi:hypothetical protein
MALRDLDREYWSIVSRSYEERMEYCENLISRMRSRLASESADNSHIRLLMLEMIESAEREIKILNAEKKESK